MDKSEDNELEILKIAKGPSPKKASPGKTEKQVTEKVTRGSPRKAPAAKKEENANTLEVKKIEVTEKVLHRFWIPTSGYHSTYRSLNQKPLSPLNSRLLLIKKPHQRLSLLHQRQKKLLREAPL